MTRNIIITVLRNDLRIHDQASFHAAHTPQHSNVTHLLPLYVYDERNIELSGLPNYKREGPPAKTRIGGFWRTGVFRARFLSEAVYDLRDRLRQRHSDLLIRFGKLEQVTLNVVKNLQANGDTVKAIFMQKDFCSEEIAIENNLKKLMQTVGVHITFFDTNPLIDPRDLPFPIDKCPDVFTPFRKKVEALGKLGRDPVEMPSQFKPFPTSSSLFADTGYGAEYDNKSVDELLVGLFKPLEDSYETKFADPKYKRDAKSAFPFRGGETSALERLDWYFHSGHLPPVAKYKETRNGLLGHEYSTKLSPFLCLGMISPRTVMQSLDEHERVHGETQNTYWVRFEMLWRDYFLYIARKFGTKLFTLGGFEEVTDPKQARMKTRPGWWVEWDPREPKISRWLEGKTGVPFIDANMAELRETGFMSNRGRQNVASFLTKDLGVDWRIGAEFFESHLVDFEPTANYGNWEYVAGVGNDPRASRQFNPIKQGHDHDPHGEYIKTWIPALANVPSHRVHSPWILSLEDKKRYITGDYPDTPIIEQSNWKPHYTRRGPSKTQGNPNERVKNPGPGGAKGGTGGGGGNGGARGGGGGGGRGRHGDSKHKGHE